MKYLVLMALALLLPLQEKNEAEELFKKMEEKLAKAKTVSLKLDGAMEPMKLKLGGGLSFGEGNLVHLHLEGSSEGVTETVTIVSDGKSRRMKAEGKPARDFETPATFGALVRTCFARAGFLGTLDHVDTESDAKTEASAAYLASDFKMGAKEKIGDRDAQAVEYALNKPNDRESATVTLWIDVASHLPLKRALKKGTRSLTETYSDLKLDEKIDPAKFELPK